MKRAWLPTFFLLLLSACSTIHYVNIETKKPAEITFPSMVNKILIVNNAVPQPEKSGYEFTFMGVVQDSARAKADSALFDVCEALGLEILDTDYFNDVLLFHDATRDDDDFIADKKLTPETVRALCKETDAGAIISVDRLLFETDKDIFAVGGGFLFGSIRVKMTGVLRAYLPERENPLATVLLSDSVFWTEQGGTLEEIESNLPSPENALREAAKYLGSKAAPNFVPHWQNDVRWFYSGGTTAWRQASAYASAQRWEEAEKLWESLYGEATNKVNQAKIASNIAFALEMQGEYDTALEWAEKAKSVFEEYGKNSQDYQLLSQYTTVLQERIRENNKLNVQFGDF